MHDFEKWKPLLLQKENLLIYLNDQQLQDIFNRYIAHRHPLINPLDPHTIIALSGCLDAIISWKNSIKNFDPHDPGHSGITF